MRKPPKHRFTDEERSRAGYTTAAKLTPEQRTARARGAVQARWAKARKIKRIGSKLSEGAAA